MDRFNRNIMLKLLIYKQELIDRYNYYMYQKKNHLNGDEDCDKEYDINLKNSIYSYCSNLEQYIFYYFILIILFLLYLLIIYLWIIYNLKNIFI